MNVFHMMLIFAVALLVLPCSAFQAQKIDADVEAHLKEVWAKLEAAVDAGKMSAEDAKAKMASITKATSSVNKKKAVPAKKHAVTYAHLKKMSAKLKSAVEAGKMSAEDALTKLDAIIQGNSDTTKKKAGTRNGQPESDAYLKRLKEKLQKAVAAGKMSAKDAEAKINAKKKARMRTVKDQAHMAAGAVDEKTKIDTNLKQVWAKLQAAVDAGIISAEDAQVTIGAIKKKLRSKANK